MIDAARALLGRACSRAGFPGPRDDEGLAAWADGLFDNPLAPRGSPDWQAAHEHAIDALEAALNGNEAIAHACLARAFAVVQSHARRECTCEIEGATFRDALDRARCVKCLGRQIQAGS